MILINGYFLCRTLTGIERYAMEITKRLDILSSPGELAIIVPKNCNHVPEYKNITIIRYYKIIPHFIWQFLFLQFYLLFHPQYIILDFSNTCLPFFPGIIFLHDIYCEFFPNDFISPRDKFVRLYNRWQYRLISKKAKRIITVSQFSKSQIVSQFKLNPNKIEVIPNSWEHFQNIECDYSIIKKLKKSNLFYFS